MDKHRVKPDLTHACGGQQPGTRRSGPGTYLTWESRVGGGGKEGAWPWKYDMCVIFLGEEGRCGLGETNYEHDRN